jgi:hypothetical protein
MWGAVYPNRGLDVRDEQYHIKFTLLYLNSNLHC